MENKPILVLDFDGVLHSYTSGWKGAEIIPDPPVDGAVAFCEVAVRDFEVHIVSSRCSQPGGADAIDRWMAAHGFPEEIEVSPDGTKPAAFLTLDDRAITFTGTWPDPRDLRNFQPWYKTVAGVRAAKFNPRFDLKQAHPGVEPKHFDPEKVLRQGQEVVAKAASEDWKL